MAWISPVSRATGYLVTAARWNQDIVANTIDLDERLAGVAARFPVALSGGFDIAAGSGQTRTLTEALSGFRFLQVPVGIGTQAVEESLLVSLSVIPAHGISNPVMYAADGGADSLYTINPTTGEATLVGALGINLGNDAGLGAHQGVLYLASTDGKIYDVNTATGAARLIGSTGITVGGRGRSLASHGGVLYHGQSNDFYSINVASGTATLIASDQTREMWGMASHNGVLYGVDGGNLFSISPTTGAQTPIGPTGLSHQNGEGLTSQGNTLYLREARGILFTVNPTTGGTTRIGDDGLGAGNEATLASLDTGARVFVGRYLSLARGATATELTVSALRSGRVHGIVGIR